MSKKYSAYWIHLPEHSDIMNEGYVGISNNTKRRFKEHNKSKNSIISNAIQKYGSELLWDVVFENLSYDEAIKIERNLRPNMRIGWNIMTGGNIPPSFEGMERPSHSERMKGKNNPFHGKTHSDDVKLLLSEGMRGENNPFYGKKRPDHSEKMKEKRGISYPRFRGYFVTPFGKFDSHAEAISVTGIKMSSLYEYCTNSDKKISALSYSKSNILKKVGEKTEIVGKTYKEIGFYFEYI